MEFQVFISLFDHTKGRPGMNRKLTRDQRAILKDFCETYGFDEKQIGFDGASVEPIFDFDALSALSLRLCNLPKLSVTFDRFEGHFAFANVSVKLANGNEREFPACARMGELMPDGEPATEPVQLANLARSRALRIGLRAATFDPVKSHAAMKRGEN